MLFEINKNKKVEVKRNVESYLVGYRLIGFYLSIHVKKIVTHLCHEALSLIKCSKLER